MDWRIRRFPKATKNKLEYEALGQVMGDRLLPKFALCLILLGGGLVRSQKGHIPSKYQAYVKIREFLAKGFIKEPYKLHYQFNEGWKEEAGGGASH